MSSGCHKCPHDAEIARLREICVKCKRCNGDLLKVGGGWTRVSIDAARDEACASKILSMTPADYAPHIPSARSRVNVPDSVLPYLLRIVEPVTRLNDTDLLLLAAMMKGERITDFARRTGVTLAPEAGSQRLRNVINKEVDDYFQIMMRFDNGVTATLELGTYFLSDKMHDKWFERHWFLGGNKGSAYVDGFFPEGKIVRTAGLLQNVGGKRTMTAAGPTRSFGPPPEGKILTEELPKVDTNHRNYFENYVKAWHGEEEFLVKIPETRRVLRLMDAVRESGRTGKSIDFE